MLFTEICEYLNSLLDYKHHTVYFWSSRAENILLYKDNKLWITNDLRLSVIWEVHD